MVAEAVALVAPPVPVNCAAEAEEADLEDDEGEALLVEEPEEAALVAATTAGYDAGAPVPQLPLGAMAQVEFWQMDSY